MNINNCNCPESNPCGQITPCVEPNCACPVIISSDCVNNVTVDLPCLNVTKGKTLNEFLLAIDLSICAKLLGIVSNFVLKNVGTGIGKLYKGVSIIGEKEIKSIEAGTLISITNGTSDIGVAVDTIALTTFVSGLEKTTTVSNLGTSGGKVYNEVPIVVGNNTEYKLRRILTANAGIGAPIIKTQVESANDITIPAKSLILSNVGVIGEEVLKPIINGVDDITISAKKIASKGTIIVETSVDGNTLYIDTPTTATIPALYVNNLYVPTYNDWLSENKIQNTGVAIAGFIFRGKGTMAQPFTDNIIYPLLGGVAAITNNTAIQNALDGDIAYAIKYSYIGSGTRLAPQKSGQKIIVQDNVTGYTFAGVFSYMNLNLKVEQNINCINTGYLIDMDNTTFFNSDVATTKIEINNSSVITLFNSLGFNNSGNTLTTLPAYDTGRVIEFIGEGVIYSPYNGGNVLTRYIFNGDGNVNDSNLHYNIKCKVLALFQGVYFSKGKTNFDFYNLIQSGQLNGSVNIALKAFHMTGGQIRFFEKGSISLGSEVSGRTYGITFEPPIGGTGYTVFALNKAQVAGTSQSCFAKLNNEYVQFTAFNSPSGDGFVTSLVGTSTIVNGLFENLGATKWNINFQNNLFSYTGIDQTKVDLTQGNTSSVVNFIGNKIIESLVTRTSRIAAAGVGSNLPVGSVFLNTNGVGNPTSTWFRDIVI